MSKIEVDKVDPQSGTALEIGTSGDTVTVPSGVGLTLTNATLLLPTTINTDKIDPKSGTALEIGTSGDTITVPTGAGLTVTDEVKTNKISPATGVAFALGDSGDTFTVPSGATIANLGTATGFGAANTPAFEYYLSATQTIANATWTKITIDTEVFDTDSAFASNKFTVPAGEGGKYFFNLACQFAQDDRQSRIIGLYKNGARVKNLFRNHGVADTALCASGSATLDLSATDYIEAYCYQNSADPLDISGAADLTYFSGFKITT